MDAVVHVSEVTSRCRGAVHTELTHSRARRSEAS
jgi:hypothetical protein